MGLEVTSEWINNLLNSEESRLLEFKERFYDFSDHEQKTEFVKDVLALANSAEEGEHGAIVFGVRDRKNEGGLIGLKKHPQTEQLTQILETYSSPVPQIEYRAVTHTDVSLGLLLVPYSSFRPHWATRGPSGLVRHAIYLRRNDRVGIATGQETEALVMQKYADLGYTVDPSPIRIGFVEIGDASRREVVAQVVNLTVDPVSNVDLILHASLPGLPGVYWNGNKLTGDTLNPGESREVSFNLRATDFYREKTPLKEDDFRHIVAAQVDLRLIAHYRDREGFIRQISEMSSIHF